ncbi:MAG TPA: carboxypeptidase regulatory-like domain-containing protein [Candidatus Saccharicenans sp.]|nr:carboxypeptidase regulatory-like domain-containing protein [Candidatus Saccharicenans sp.]
MKKVNLFWLIVGIFLFTLVLGYGQEMQTGSIRGKIIDDNGMPLPGVSVTIRGPALLGSITSVTNQDGMYRAPGLPPGSDYEVKAELPGFESVVRRGIIVRIGMVVTIDIQMKPSTLEEEVTVVAPSPTVDVVSSTKSTLITTEVLSSLPLSRTFGSILAIAPGTTGTSIYGSGSGETGAVIDGIQANDADQNMVGIGTDVGMAWDMVEEAELVTSGASAEYYGSALGQTVMVMKSGGNKLTGEFSFYYTNEDLVQVHLPETDLAVLNLAKPSVPIYSYDGSAAIGGAIIKDKIWYMAEFRYMNSKYTGNFRPTVINGKQYDNYDRTFPNYIGYLKLTFQLAKNVRGSLMGHYSMQDVPYYYSGWNLTAEANKHNKPIRFNYSGTLSWFIDSNTILNLRAGGLYFKWTGTNTKEADPNGPHFIDSYTGYVWGNTGPEEYTWKPKVNIVLSLTKYVDNFLGGDHEFKAGIEWERNRGDWGFYMKQPLFWYYYDGDPYYWRAQNGGVTDPIYGDGLLEYLVMGDTYGSGYESGITSRIGGFVQDSYKIKDLTVNLGFRLDHIKAWSPGRVKSATADPVALAIGETYFKPVYGLNPYDEVDYDTWDNAFPYGVFFSPRIGLTYDLFGNHKTALKASFAHQAEPFPTGTFSAMYPLTWRSFTFNWWDLNNNGQPDVPGTDEYQEAYGETPLAMISDAYLKAIDPNVKVPYVNEFNFGVEHELLKDFQVSVHYIIKKRGNLLGSVLWDEESDRYWYSHELAPEWWIPFTTIVPAYGSFPEQEVTMYFLSNDAPDQFYRLKNVPEASWKFRSLEIAFNKRMSNGWQLGGSANFSKNPGNYPVSWQSSSSFGVFSNANSFVNRYGEMPYSRPTIIKLYGTFNLPYQIMFSFIFQHVDGSPWGRTVRVLPPEQWAAEHNVSSTGYSINVETPGTRWNEPYDNLDIRFQKDFRLGPGNLGFYVDIFNLLGAYTLTINKNPGGTWRPVNEATSEGSFTPGSLGLRGFSGSRQIRFSVLYRF